MRHFSRTPRMSSSRRIKASSPSIFTSLPVAGFLVPRAEVSAAEELPDAVLEDPPLPPHALRLDPHVEPLVARQRADVIAQDGSAGRERVVNDVRDVVVPCGRCRVPRARAARVRIATRHSAHRAAQAGGDPPLAANARDERPNARDARDQPRDRRPDDQELHARTIPGVHPVREQAFGGPCSPTARSRCQRDRDSRRSFRARAPSRRARGSSRPHPARPTT